METLKRPHHVRVNTAGTVAYVVSKGDPLLTTVDGSFAVIDISNPASLSVLDSELGTGDLIDARTVQVVDANKVVVFANNIAILYDVSVTTNITRLDTEAFTGVINGAVMMNGYIFAASMDGKIFVFTVAGSNLTRTDTYNVNTIDGIATAFDIDMVNSEHVAISNNGAGEQFAIYKVFNAGSILPSASWIEVGQLNSTSSPDLQTANRVLIVGNKAILHQNAGGNNIVSIDISNLASPTPIYDFSNGGDDSSGKALYRGKIDISAKGEGIRLLDVTQNPFIQYGGYHDIVNFTESPRNTHEIDFFYTDDSRYCIVTFQDDFKVAVFKINRV
jgi:hypothetical protein